MVWLSMLTAATVAAGPEIGPAFRVASVQAPSDAPIRLDDSLARTEDRRTAKKRLHASLARLVNARARAADDLAAASGFPRSLIDGNRVLVEVRFRQRGRMASAVRGRGGEVRHQLNGGVMEAWMPIASLEALAADEDVARVWPAVLVDPLEGAVLTQGFEEGQAGPWHDAAFDGSGVTVAIIDSFNDTGGQIPTLQSSDDWPPPGQVTTLKMGSGSFGDQGVAHGNAVMEIAFDIAPGAEYIAYDTTTVGDWINAIDDAVARGADIISASLGAPMNGIGDGSALPGSVAEAVESAEAAGVIYINAAGNSRQKHWGGLYDPSSGDADFHAWDGNNQQVNFHGPANGKAWCLADDAPLRGELFWADWTDVDHDYDLLLVEYDGSAWNVVTSSQAPQDGSSGQRPQEYVDIRASSAYSDTCSGSGGIYGWAISRFDAPTDVNIQFFSPIEFDQRVLGSSLGFPADSSAAVTVAALNHADSSHENYSSEGPILAPGGDLPTGSEHPKPEVASFARVDTISYGTGAFAGTSAAAPHVAGMAALLKQRHPAMTRNELVDRLQQISATGSNDLGDLGHDFQHGDGRLRFQLEDALAITQQPTDVEIDELIGAFKLKLLDDEGLVVLSGPTSELNVAIGNDPSSGDATLSGTAIRPVVDGLTSFDDLSIDTHGEGYTLSVDSAGSGPVESDRFNITGGTPAQLSFDVQPSNAIAGQAISPDIVVQVLDIHDKLVTDDNSTEVVLSIAAGPGSATLSGGGPVTVSNGEAVFSSASIDAAADGYQLEATDTGGDLTPDTSVSFDIAAGDAAGLAFGVQPGATKIHEPITPAITVQVVDSNGNLITDDSSTEVELAISAGPGGATLSGGGPVTVAGGEAVFDAVSIDQLGEGYQLDAMDTGSTLGPATSVSFEILPGDPAGLAFVVQPSDGTTTDPIQPAVEVELLDADGNRVTWDNETAIELILLGEPGDTMSGGGPLTVTDGLAVFDSLVVEQAGSDYKLEAADSEGALPSIESVPFEIIVDEVFADRFEDASP